jgi:hypothetical protein
MEFKMVDTDTGYSEIVHWQGADQDTGGKSFGQAVTECCKRFYFKLFNVSSLGEVDPDSKTDECIKAAEETTIRETLEDEVRSLLKKSGATTAEDCQKFTGHPKIAGANIDLVELGGIRDNLKASLKAVK